MKILYHHRVVSRDGQYVHIEEIIQSLKKQHHEIILVAPGSGQEQGFGGDGGLVSKLKQKLPKALYELVEFGYTFWAFFKLAIAIKRHRPDFIYERYNLYHPAGIWAKKLFNLPLLLEINAPLYEERAKYDGLALHRLARWSEHYSWCNADLCLPVTDVLADYQRHIGIDDKKIRVIPNGINETFYATVASRPDHLEDKLVIGFVGFCRGWHGLDKVLEVMAGRDSTEAVHFLVVGDGPARQALQRKASELELEKQFEITGLVGREDMPGWLDCIDIALQPDVVPYASPLKILEYMAKGKAIVAPDTANIRELLNHEHNALLFNPSDQQSFSAAVNRLCSNITLRKRLGDAAARTIAERGLTWDSNARRIVEYYCAVKGIKK